MPRNRQSPGSASDPSLGPVGPGVNLGPPPPGHGGPPPPQGPMFSPDNHFGGPGNDGFDPTKSGPGGPPMHNSEFNHDFLDDLIPPVTSDSGGFGPQGPNIFDGPSGMQPMPPHSFSGPMAGQCPPRGMPMSGGPGPQCMPYSMQGPPDKAGMGGPGGMGPAMHPAGPLGSGKIYPHDQPMVFNRSNPNAPPIYPCGICHKEVHDNDQAILCESGCNFWFHRICTGLSEPAFIMLTKEVYAEWVCDRCLSTKAIPLVKMKP